MNQTVPKCKVCDKIATSMCSSCGPSIPYCSADCQRQDWVSHRVNCRAQISRDADRSALRNPSQLQAAPQVQADMNDQEELKYYMQQIYLIVKPVVCCILLSVLWVKISLMGSDFKPQRSSLVTVYEEKADDSTETRFVGSLSNALIILSQVIVATILFVVLFKYGCYKILYGYIFLVVAVILGLMSFLLLLNLIQVLSVPLDYITLCFSLWNFAIVGNTVIFWRGPLWMQQAYLVIMSSLMAFALTGLEAWTTWMLLGILAVWDLVAVLCPFGPLKLLVESSRNQNRDIPALLYSVTMLYFGTSSPSSSGPFGDTSLPMEKIFTDQKRQEPIEMRDGHGETTTRSSNQAEGAMATNENMQSQSALLQVRAEPSLMDPAQVRTASHHPSAASGPSRPPLSTNNTAAPQEESEEEERNGLKLGLGDFVFYSVLIARTATFDWVTTIACMVAVMTGLNMTIFLLAIYKKALPALPISIAFGLLFYFVSSLTLVPLVNRLALSGIII